MTRFRFTSTETADVQQRLSTMAPITLKLKLEDQEVPHELVMVAENLGRIPQHIIDDCGCRHATV